MEAYRPCRMNDIGVLDKGFYVTAVFNNEDVKWLGPTCVVIFRSLKQNRRTDSLLHILSMVRVSFVEKV